MCSRISPDLLPQQRRAAVATTGAPLRPAGQDVVPAGAVAVATGVAGTVAAYRSAVSSVAVLGSSASPEKVRFLRNLGKYCVFALLIIFMHLKRLICAFYDSTSNSRML